MQATEIKNALLALGSPERATHSSYFFKTGKGQYGEGDRFIGCKVPETRKVASLYRATPQRELEKLLADPLHECRLCALVILVSQFRKADDATRREIVDFYLSHTDRINNWDLVDLSCYHIVGEWLKDKEDRSLLYRLAESELLWDQRIAMVSTLAFIRINDFNDTLRLSEMFLTHSHDLMHKATGWMLREVGKRDEQALTGFLDRFHRVMPRTMLRYAIERLTSEQKVCYMQRPK
ncbi:MAG TPA: DNA alkylation repair protein [Proteiniphilum sp.]|nr:DNA alkylation repair protein [Proteiniphilum sp.]HPD87570.1 DNA alkylation repair protein [Proteiniphilum sp.]HPJ49203.1 DNA alkylation repair protein [Proteiniphilum sp.]HPR19137.1 DNA alkylation repair protein [Proteiniphilum sp.]